MKNKIYFILRKIFTPTFIKVILLAVPVILVIIYKKSTNTLSFDNLFDIKTFVAIIIAFICQSISIAIVNIIERHFEDAIKLTTDYQLLIKKYSRTKLLSFNQVSFPIEILQFRTQNESSFTLEFDSSHALNNYELPKQIAAQSSYLMSAHKHSKIYNRLNIRLDDLVVEDGNTKLVYSQTYYFDSMVTNRAMDFKLENGKTVREIYEPGPFLKPLNKSKFSNHLGFNGFIELSDRNIIFVVRDKDLSIGKNTLACSIGASLKSEYALDDNLQFTKAGLNRAIIKEVKDELNIDIPEAVDLTSSIFTFCRDVLEGGRPQFLFYYKLSNLSSTEFLKQFNARNNKEEKYHKKIDGSKFIFLNTDELQQCKIIPDKIVLPNNDTYKMMPLASGSIALLLNHINANIKKAI